MTAILLSPQFDFSEAYFLIVGVGGTPPDSGTIAAVFWADWLVDYDLGHRWAMEDGLPNTHAFSPRKGYEDVRTIKLNQQLVNQAINLTKNIILKDSNSAKTYRQRYASASARRAPFVGVGTHVAGDTFFHGPGLSKEAQYICELYGTSPYVITEMEGVAVAYVIRKILDINRVMSLRTAVNFDQGSASESTLQHLDPEPGNTPGGFDVGLQNNFAVGSTWVDHMVANWPD
jgi:purine nucleoside permease